MLVALQTPAWTQEHDAIQDFLAEFLKDLADPAITLPSLGKKSPAHAHLTARKEVQAQITQILAAPLPERQHAPKAHAQDRTFHQFAVGFTFSSHGPLAATPEYQKLYKQLYDKVLGGPGFQFLPGLAAGAVVDRAWVRSLVLTTNALPKKQLLDCCPYCGGELREIQLDHFLAKQRYPTLAVHLWNLVPACFSCNKVAQKGCRDAIRPTKKSHPIPLADICFPYTNQSLEEFLYLSFPAAPPYHVQVTAKRGSPPGIVRQIDNFVRLIDLEKRWNAELDGVERSAVKTLRELLRFKPKATATAGLNHLARLAKDCRKLYKQGDNYFLKSHFWAWLTRDTNRFQPVWQAAKAELQELGRV